MIELIERRENFHVSESKREIKGRDEVCELMLQEPWEVMTSYDPVMTRNFGFNACTGKGGETLGLHEVRSWN